MRADSVTMSTARSDAGVDDVDHRRLYGKIALRLSPILFLIFFFANIDRANVGFAAAALRQDLGFSNAAYGLGAGIFFLGYFLFEVPSNIALQKVGAKVWFTRIVLTWGLATFALAFVKDTTWFYILRFIVGAAEAGAAPGVMLYLSQWVPNSQRGRFNALYWLSAPMAFVVSGPLSGLILTRLNGTAGYAGWQWLFMIEGLITMIMAPVILYGLANTIQDAKWLTPAEKRVAANNILDLNKSAHAHSYRDALRQPVTLVSSLAYFTLLIGYYGIAFWLPQLIKQSGVSDTMTIGWLSALPWLAAAIAVVFVGPLSDKAGWRGIVRTLSIAMTSIGFWMSAYFADRPGLSLLGLTVAAIGILAASTVFWANLAQIYIGPAAAVAFAVINSLGNLGGFVSPYMLGIVTDLTGSAVMGMYAITCSMVISGILMIIAFGRSRT
ncbi:MFS transporter [Chelatococcus reniformis]|uniref:MFS transporter n=1 Tax=Chelatococcus reniformis TaxID=1494448 RepID=A0A916U9H7_9HYPH|nr:MFS transporter [Chelatococcus reniformis]GGC65546.1 MFS transporter [Chelatococcus reniformis]